VKIGLLQMAPVLGNLAANLERLDALLPELEGCRVAVLPELCNSGYNFESREHALACAESLDASPFLDHLASACARHGFHLVVGLCERDGDELYNSAVLVGPEGPLGTYRKVHLFNEEKLRFAPGNLGFPVFQLGELRLGILICFDWHFPEAFRILALKGADLICHPSNLVIPGRCQQAVCAHALLNHVYVATANRTGTERGLTFTGESLIADPAGQVVARATREDAMCLAVEIDLALARDKMATPRNHIVDDRRPELYGELLAGGGG